MKNILSTMNKDKINFETQKRLLEKVYQRLAFSNNPDVKEIEISPKVKSVLQSIEEKENTWQLEVQSGERVHGQKEVGEPIRFWSVPKDSAEFLMYLVSSLKPESILEIGTSVGYSTIHLALGTEMKITTLESLHEKAVLAKENFKNAGLKNINLVESKAQDYISDLSQNEMFDFVFLDADKENYGRYFDALIGHISVGGIIVADNVLDYGHSMQDFLSKVMGTKFAQSSSDKRVVSFLLPIDNGLLVVKKVSN